MAKLVNENSEPLEYNERATFPQSGMTALRPEDDLKVEKQQIIEQVLQERGKRYGDFTTHALISQKLKQVFYDHMTHHNSNGFETIQADPTLREGLDMIFHKLGRVANGDPLYKDNFVDIAGYAKLVADSLEF